MDELDILRAEHLLLSDAQPWIWEAQGENRELFAGYISGLYDATEKLLKMLGEKTDET